MATRTWVFTLNNYTAEQETAVQALDLAYLVYGREVGESGTPHLQGLIHDKLMRFSAVKKLIPSAHWEAAIARPDLGIAYCKKDGDFFEKGTPPQQGKRNDLVSLYKDLEETATMRDILATRPNMQQIRVAETWLKYNEPRRDWLPEVFWFWGPPGSGKTRKVYEMAPDVYSVPSSPQLKWWDRYDSHDDVLIDDFRGDQCDFARFLKMIDRYEFQVECKGGYRQLRAKRMFITSCVPPWECWYTNENLEQIRRRLAEIKSFHRVQQNGWKENGVSQAIDKQAQADV